MATSVTAAPGPGAATLSGVARVERFRERYARMLEWLVGGLMIVLAAEVTLGVVYRAIGDALIWYDEIASHLLAWLTFYGAALGSARRAHIGCPEVVMAMPWRARRAFNIAAQVLVIGFFALFGAVGVMVMPVLATDELVSVPIPMNVVQSVIPISSVLILIAEVAWLVELVRAREPVALGDAGAGANDALH